MPGARPELRCTEEVSGGPLETRAVQPRTPSLPAGHQETGSGNLGKPVLAWAMTEGCQLLLTGRMGPLISWYGYIFCLCSV